MSIHTIQPETAADHDDIAILGGLPVTTRGIRRSAENLVAQAIAARGRMVRPFYSTSANGQVIALASKDERFKSMLMSADEIHADGMPMVLVSRLLTRHPIHERVATTDLVHAVAAEAELTGATFYFLGGSPEVNQRAVERMKEKYPRLNFVGARHGYYAAEEEDAIVADIARVKPDILWIGFGVPLEQQFVDRNIDKLRGVGAIKTSGGLFDFLAGRNSRAPKWMQNVGLEWAYRTLLEPRRLAGRYFSTNPIALQQLLINSR